MSLAHYTPQTLQRSPFLWKENKKLIGKTSQKLIWTCYFTAHHMCIIQKDQHFLQSMRSSLQPLAFFPFPFLFDFFFSKWGGGGEVLPPCCLLCLQRKKHLNEKEKKELLDLQAQKVMSLTRHFWITCGIYKWSWTLLLQQCTFQVQCLFRKQSVLNTLHWYGPQANNTNPKLQITVIYLLKDGEKEMIRSTTEIGEKKSKNNQKDQYDHIHHIHLIKAALCTASLDQKVVFPINITHIM